MEKKVIIMRGLPGSGKSTKAKTYGGTICSADDYFIVDGEYRFNKFGLGLAHDYCRSKFNLAITCGDPIIVIDNTNTKEEEYMFYKKTAYENGYKVVVDSLFDGGLSVEKLAERNIHGCPKESIQRMKNRYTK